MKRVLEIVLIVAVSNRLNLKHCYNVIFSQRQLSLTNLERYSLKSCTSKYVN